MKRATNGSSAQPRRILLVEDNAGDADLTAEALRETQVPHELFHVSDGGDALLFLRQQGRFRTVPSIDVILLDLNLPCSDGREVLAEIKKDSALRSIPVVILTTSAAERDVQSCYELQANSYLTKPVDLNQFVDVMEQFAGFWLRTARVPTHPQII